MPLTLIRPLVFFDLETTGVDIQNARIVEISLLKLFEDDHEEIHTFLVNPGIPILAEASAIHNIYDADVANQPTFVQLAPQILEILSDSDLCGYNLIKFDLPILRMEFVRYNINFNIDGINLIDPMRIFMKNEPRDLTSALKFYCDEELTNAHSAEADIKATKKILLAQLERYADVPSTVVGLSNYSTEDLPRFADISGKLVYNANNVILFNFGRYQGQRAIDHRDYIGWMLGADFSEDTKQILRDLLNLNH